MQCKSLNVWSVYFFFNTLSCQNYFFQGVWGIYKIVVEIPERWGGYFSGQKLEIPGRRGGLREIPSLVGVWIFSGTTHFWEAAGSFLYGSFCGRDIKFVWRLGGLGGGGGGGRVLPEKLGGLPKPLPYLWPNSAIFSTLFMTWPLYQNLVSQLHYN